MKNALLMVFLAISTGLFGQNLLIPRVEVLSTGETLYDLDTSVLEMILLEDSIDLQVGNLSISGIQEVKSYNVTTSGGTSFTQIVTFYTSETSILSIYPDNEIFFYEFSDIPLVLERIDDFYVFRADTTGEAFECVALPNPGLSNPESEVSTFASKVVDVYIEVDKALHDNKGGVQGAVNYVTSLFETVKILYSNEQISAEISEIFVWNTADPYSKTSSVDALNTFRATRPNANGNLKHLIALGGNNLGGVAYVNVLCTQYAYAYSNVQASFNQFPNYSWSVMVVAHEMGHNLGSPHTHACKWGVNKNQALEGCWPTEGGCPDPGIPSDGGTIMSYCHLKSVGINFNKGFGVEPGNLIRERVSAAGCLSEGSTCDPITVTVGSITQTSARLSWNQTPESTYRIRYRVNGTSSWTNSATNQTTYTLSGLSPATSYQVQVRPDCEPNWGTVIAFSTLAPPAVCEPFLVKTFESTIDMNQSTADNLNWNRRSGRTPSTGTGPSGTYKGSYYIYVESSRNGQGYPGKTAILESKCFDLEENTFLQFAYHMYGSTMGSLKMEIGGNVIWSKSGDQGNRWRIAKIPVPAGNKLTLKITATTGASWRSDIALDHIQFVVEQPKLCEASPGDSYIEWIESVQIGDLTQLTGNNNGYLSKEIDITSGVYPVYLTPGFIRENFTEYWYVYTGANGEWIQVFTSQGNDVQATQLAITEGTTMRVIMSYFPISGACENVEFGEIEDYILR